MLVCDCIEMDYKELKQAVKTYGGDIEVIKEKTEAGTVCECCLEEDCDKVDLSLPLAIKQAIQELK